MNIKREHTISQVQEAFHELYPGLQVRFYSKPHQDHQGSVSEFEIGSQTPVAEVNSALVEGTIDLSGDQSVAELEHKFHDQFGLNAQIFRRSASLWLQTTRTDDWSLEKANRKGISSVEKSGGTL